MSKENVKFYRDTIIKTGYPDSMRIEVEKTVRAFKIGQDCGLFRVPKVLDYDESKGEAVLERLHNIQPVRDVIAFGRRNDSLVEAIGTSLAIIHDKLQLPKDMVVHLPPDFSMSGSEVFLHGDLSVNNVCVGPKYPPIVILDWQMTNLHGGRATYGTRYFDLMWFITNLFYLRSRGLRYLLSNPTVSLLAKKFVVSYFEGTGFEYDLEELAVYMKLFFEVIFKLRKQELSWKRRLAMTICFPFFRKFTTSFRL